MNARSRFVALDADDDPTGTADIRDAFAADLSARWALLRRLVQEAAPVISGAGKAAAGVAGWLGLDRAGPFREWLDVAMERTLLEGNGAWVNPYIQQAVEIAERRAVSIGGAPLGHSFTSDVVTLQGVAVSELRGICAAVLQQATRQAAVMALGRASPEAITAAIFSRIDALGQSRSHQMAGYMVVKAHALATLASFRGAGVTHVGLVPENAPPEPREPEPDPVKEATEVAAAATLASMAGLAATPTKPMARWEAAAMRRAAGEEEPAEEVTEAPHEVELRRLAAAAAAGVELARLPWGEKPEAAMANIVTAGDDRVCPTCLELASRNPYPIDEAMDLIPAHFGCRCVLVPVMSIADAAKSTLYVRRDVFNAPEIIAWAKAQGFKTALPPGDMHVTIAFSRAPVDWGRLTPDTSSVSVVGGARSMQQFGDAVVLSLESDILSARHDEIAAIGASWDFLEYRPHVTITYDAGDVEIGEVAPFAGRIVLGPEVFEPVKEDWKSNLVEDGTPKYGPF